MKSWSPILLGLAAVACSSPRDAEPSSDTSSDVGSTAGQTEGMAPMQMDGDGSIRVTRRQAVLAGVTFATAAVGPVDRTVRAVAMVVPNERRLGVVNARVSGWVEKLHVNETGQHVSKGAPLFELYAPDLVAAQEELVLASKLAALAGGDSLVVAARQRLALWDVPEQVIARVEETGRVMRRLTLRSPYRGHVLEKSVIEGQMVHAGDQLFMIADLSTVWIEPAIFEGDIARIREGQRADVVLDALPGRVFSGRVTFLHPTLDAATRTLRVRIEIANPDGVIRPAMFGTVRIRTQGAPGVIVPLTAVLPTGEKNFVFRWRGGEIVPTSVLVGMRGDSTVLVVDGLAAGDTVVASATFLFDSESSLGAAMAGIMLDMGMGLDMGGMDMDGEAMDGMQMDGSDSGTSNDPMPRMEPDGGRQR